MMAPYKRLAVLTAISVAIASPAVAQIATPAMPIGSPGSWIHADDYPPDAIRAGRSGRVVVDLGIDDKGRVTDCIVRISSDTASLDQATCRAMTVRGAFTPATDARGRAVATTFSVPVRWAMPNPVTIVDLSSGPIRTDTEFEQVIGADGALIACNLQTPVQPQQVDPCARLVIGSITRNRFVRDGKPVGAIVRQRFTSTLTASGAP